MSAAVPTRAVAVVRSEHPLPVEDALVALGVLLAQPLLERLAPVSRKRRTCSTGGVRISIATENERSGVPESGLHGPFRNYEKLLLENELYRRTVKLL